MAVKFGDWSFKPHRWAGTSFRTRMGGVGPGDRNFVRMSTPEETRNLWDRRAISRDLGGLRSAVLADQRGNAPSSLNFGGRSLDWGTPEYDRVMHTARAYQSDDGLSRQELGNFMGWLGDRGGTKREETPTPKSPAQIPWDKPSTPWPQQFSSQPLQGTPVLFQHPSQQQQGWNWADFFRGGREFGNQENPFAQWLSSLGSIGKKG